MRRLSRKLKLPPSWNHPYVGPDIDSKYVFYVQKPKEKFGQFSMKKQEKPIEKEGQQMKVKRRKYNISVSVDNLINKFSFCSGLYCWITGFLAAVFPHPPWMTVSLLITLSLSTAINALALRFGSQE